MELATAVCLFWWSDGGVLALLTLLVAGGTRVVDEPLMLGRVQRGGIGGGCEFCGGLVSVGSVARGAAAIKLFQKTEMVQ